MAGLFLFNQGGLVKIMSPQHMDFSGGRDNFSGGHDNFSGGHDNFSGGHDNFKIHIIFSWKSRTLKYIFHFSLRLKGKMLNTDLVLDLILYSLTQRDRALPEVALGPRPGESGGPKERRCGLLPNPPRPS